MPVSKEFAIATEGATTDGRKITADWIKQMAETYDPKTFTALGNLEHYLSMMPDSVFSAYGKVLKLSTRTTDIFGEKKLQLLATFDANDAIVALQKAGKKMFCSIEINPNFADTGKAYLQGLAFTDSPASLGTEVMQFAANAKENPFSARKKDPANLFSVAEAVSIEWEPENAKPNEGEGLFSKVMGLLGKGNKETDARFADQSEAVTAIASSQKELLTQFSKLASEKAELETKLKASDEALSALRKEFTALVEKLGTTDGDNKQRPAAAGNTGDIEADC